MNEVAKSTTGAPAPAPPVSGATRLTRPDVMNGILSLFNEPRYLEVGVNEGVTFFGVEASQKVAVDPKFLFDVEAARREQENSRFHEIPSDSFFGRTVDSDARFHVIFLDGLHTFEQTLRDFCNAIAFLTDDGIIVVDDVLPNSYHASLPDPVLSRKLRDRFTPGNKDGSWMGDVYRLVFFIETFFQQFSYATVQENHGQLVVWKRRRPPTEVVPRRVEELGRLPFECIVTDAAAFHRQPFHQILALLRDRSAPEK
jgi:hypothetical protein